MITQSPKLEQINAVPVCSVISTENMFDLFSLISVIYVSINTTLAHTDNTLCIICNMS